MLANEVVVDSNTARQIVERWNRQARPAASHMKENPVQDVLANGQKGEKGGRVLRKTTSARLRKDNSKEKETKSSPPSPRLRRLRAITLSVSAPQLFNEHTPIVRERSNSVVFSHEDFSKSLDVFWDEIEAQWDEVFSHPGKLTPVLYKKGIPNPRRERVWNKISQLIPDTELLKCSVGEEEGPEHNCIYKRLLDMKDTSHEHQIRADITRTFPSEPSIYAPAFQQSLFNVLKAFSLYDCKVGYCQGLSFVAALLLMHVKEEQAFFMLIRLLRGHNLRSFYTEDMQGMKLRMFQINKLSQFLFPEMHKHMEDLGVSIGVITTPWLMTAFGYQLPLDVALRVADVVLLEGIPALFRIALAIWVLCEKEIMQLSVDGIMDYFRSDLKTKFQDPQQLMNTAYAVNISSSQLDNLETEFYQQPIGDGENTEFGQKSAEDLLDLENTVRYSQALVGSHELTETLAKKNKEYDILRRSFDQYRMKAENEKIALVEELGQLLDKLNTVETEKRLTDEKLVAVEAKLTQCQSKYDHMSNCCQALAQEVHRLKPKGSKGLSPR